MCANNMGVFSLGCMSDPGSLWMGNMGFLTIPLHIYSYMHLDNDDRDMRNEIKSVI